MKNEEDNPKKALIQVKESIKGFNSVRRVFLRLGNPARIQVDLGSKINADDEKRIREIINETNCNYPIDIIISGNENISPEYSKCLSCN